MNEPTTSTNESLSGLRTDYHELMHQLQSRQMSLRSKFTGNTTKTSPKRSRRQDFLLQSPGAKRMKIVGNEKTLTSGSKQASSSANQKTSTPYKPTDHSRLDRISASGKKRMTSRLPSNHKLDSTGLKRLSSHHRQDSTGLKWTNLDKSCFRHSKMIENDDFVIDVANRRPKRPYPTPLRTNNTSNRSFTQQQQQTSTPKSILRRRISPIKKIISESHSPLHNSEKENTGGTRRSLRLSRSPHFHSDALRLDYHSEMMKRRRLSNDVLNESYAKQLDHTGNNRPKPDVTQGPKSILSRKTRKTPNRVSFRLKDTTPSHSLLDQSGRVQPLLGYDWIAGLLDAEDTISERSDSYFDELKDFRRVNKEDCVYRQTDEGSSSSMISGLPTTTITHPTDTHQCLHNFTLNDRLFVVPVHSNPDGESTCPICHESRSAEVSRGSPSYIRVSIPRSTLRSPYKLRPHRRRSFDATDTLGLSQHCLAGWETSRPSMLPTATNIDLKDALRPQILKEGTIGNDSLYKSSKRLPLVPTDRTQRLLNRSRSIQQQLNRMKNKHAQ